MDAAYLHLLVNHFPIVLSVVGALAAVITLFTKHRTTWTFALGALVLAGLTVYPAVFTGEGAEEAMRNVWYVDRDVVHEHEEAAEFAMWATIVTGVVAIGAMWRERTAYTGGRTILASPGWLRALVALLGVLSTAALIRSAWTAGYIVHKSKSLEQRPSSAATPASSPPPAPPAITGTTTAVPDTVPMIRPPSR